MLELKRDINQQALKIVHLNFVKSELFSLTFIKFWFPVTVIWSGELKTTLAVLST